MNYILYNPKSHSDNNDLNIIPNKDKLEKMGAQQISLLDINVRKFCTSLTKKDKVLICGGDGTLHHFVNNTRGIKFPCPMFLVRSGTGNDFLNDIGQENPDKLLDVRKYISSLPEFEANGRKRLFINGVGMGIDGAVCEKVEEFKKRTGKPASYTAIALQLLAYKYKRPAATVVVDGKSYHYHDVWMVAAMQGKFFGGGMMVAPTQSRSSGKLSVMVMHGGSRPKILSVFPSIFKGMHIKHKDIVEIFECDEVTVTFDTPAALQADGEVMTGVTTYSARSSNLVRISEMLRSEKESEALV